MARGSGGGGGSGTPGVSFVHPGCTITAQQLTRLFELGS